MNMDNKYVSVCFTGHRDVKKYDEVYNRTINAVENLINKGYFYFYVGGALGFDMLAAIVVINLKSKYPQIKLILALPFREPWKVEKTWTDNDILDYNATLEKTDRIIFINEQYKRGCYYERNRFLVDNSNICIAYQRRKSGGTAYTVDYAQKHQISVINLAKEV